jgi:predicted dehydrogenase
MRAMVVGAGSIGLRHQRVLASLGVEVSVHSRRTAPDLPAAVVASEPDLVVIATETSDHRRVLLELSAAGFGGAVVVEKPLLGALEPLPELPFRTCVVGYQLRVHPAVLAARRELAGERPLVLHAQVGQHLAAWRPGRTLGDTASARTEAGGGVLRDLSHELDLVLLLGGGWRRVCALGGRSGALGPDVATDDHWAILLELEGGTTASVQLDMLDHVGQRRLTAIAATRTVSVDLVAGTLRTAGGGGEMSADGGAPPRSWSVDGDGVLAELHRAVIEQRTDDLCDLEQGLAVVALIEAVERSAREGRWVARDEAAAVPR